MLKDTKAPTVGQFLIQSFSRVSPSIARKICEAAKLSIRAKPEKCGRHEADMMYQAIQQTKIPAGHRLPRADRRGVDSQGPA